jgi:HAD superfamily hydrolase (TIGR01509 family)
MVECKLQVKALLIDLDGTLVDSSEAYREAGKAGFAAIGFNRDDLKTAFEVARRLEQNQPIDDLFKKFHIEGEVEERFLPAYLNAYYSAVSIKSKPLPNAKETLKKLSQHFPLALITLRYVTRKQVREELKHLSLTKYFKTMITALEVKQPKPFPDAFLTAAKRLGVPINQCAIVGDSIVDIQAGKSAGAKTIAVLSGLFSREELGKQKPDLIIKNINSLPELLLKTKTPHASAIMCKD